MPESGRGFTRNAVVQREKGVAEHPERVFGSQGAIVDEHFELLLKAVYGQGGELVCGGVDVGEVVPGLPVVCAAGECQAAVRARSGEEGGGEAALGYRGLLKVRLTPVLWGWEAPLEGCRHACTPPQGVP